VELQGNVIAAAKRANVRHIVKLSAIGVGPDSPISLARWHWQTEKQVEESGIPFTHLRPHFFMQNLLGYATIKEQSALYGSMKDGKISMVDVHDIATVAARVLTEDIHEGKTYEITGPEAISYTEVAEKLSAAIGKKVTYVDVPLEASRKAMLDMGMPEWFANNLTALIAFFSTGGAAFVTNVIADVAKKQPITFDQFARDYAEAFK
jgi:uncharacterized protein YbjT (DUF2867 family)